MVAKGVRGRTAWESGVNRCKLLHLGWIDNKILLHITGNYIQYPVINHEGKKYEKECIYIHIYEKSKEGATCSVVSDSLQPHGLYVACQASLSMGFSK